MESTVSSSSIHSVWLFTDGQANAGISDPAQLIAATKERLSSHPKDLTVFTFGFGGDHNANLLQSIAEASQGSYYFIQSTTTIKESFADCLGGLLSVVAQNIKLEMQLADGVALDRVMATRYPTQEVRPGVIEVTLKDLYSEEERDILVSVKLGARTPANNVPLVTWRLSYLNLMTSALRRTEAVGSIDVVNEVSAEQQAVAPAVDKQRNRILVTEAMEEAKKAADAGNVAQARQYMMQCKAAVMTSETVQDEYVQQLQMDLSIAEECLASTQNYAQQGQQMMNQMWSSHAQQRCNRVDNDMYENNAKKCMKARSKMF